MAAVWRVLDDLRSQHGHILVIQGGAPGADTLARYWAEFREEAYANFPAHWSEHRHAAGPIRNRLMIMEMQPDEAVAFHDDLEGASKGTKDMVTELRKIGLRVTVNPHLSQGGR